MSLEPPQPSATPSERYAPTRTKQDAALYLTAALNGLRRSELLAQLWNDIDFEQASIRVW